LPPIALARSCDGFQETSIPQDLITLSRTAPYDLAWSKSVRDVAKEFGISDVALAKRCRATQPRGFFVKSANGPLDFLAWAEHYVNQLDPLHPEPRDTDFAHGRRFEYGADGKRTQEEQHRLSGHAWESTTKLVAPLTGFTRA
jgi:hypothetical protein